MTRATFGDFLHAAHWELGPDGPDAARGNVEEVSRSLLRVVIVMGRYVQDMTAAFTDVPARTRPALSPWARSCIQAREALSNAAGHLTETGGSRRWPASPAASPLARSMDTVARSLATGRDLLQTHFAPGTGSTRQHRSEWALVITSPAVTRALLSEIASLSRRIARQGADLALSPWAGTPADAEARRKLNAACQWLWALNTSVQTAHQRDPATMADRELLAAIPVNSLPPRRVPGAGEPVSALCQAAITSAERIRHLAWASARQAPWSPGMTATSLRQVAMTSTVTSHNCEILLHTLAARTRQLGLAQISADLSAAADTAARARSMWLHAARQIGQITTDTRGQLSPTAAEAGDLALGSGRLAYADPRWTPASGPAHPARPPASLAAERQDVPTVVAAVHQACETLALLGQTERDQISASAQTGRILVPTSSLPDDYDIPRPFARAPQHRIDQLLVTYADTVQASRQAAASVGEAAVATRAPSRVLSAARQAIDATRAAAPSPTPGRAAEPDTPPEPQHLPGPVENTLRGLGIAHPAMLRRAADIDKAGERLIIDAATDPGPPHSRPGADTLNSSKATSALINHALASDDPRAIGLLAGPGQHGREEPAQAELERVPEP